MAEAVLCMWWAMLTQWHGNGACKLCAFFTSNRLGVKKVLECTPFQTDRTHTAQVGPLDPVSSYQTLSHTSPC